MTFRHAEGLTALPAHHRDPFDRMLVAQAAVEELALVTRDPVFARYGVPVIEPASRTDDDPSAARAGIADQPNRVGWMP